MRERIHKRLPVKFVEEVLESFNEHRISEKEAMDLLGVRRSRLHQIRKRWLLSNRKKPFRLWQRAENAFHVISEEVKEWLDKELTYIRQEADTFRGKFNFAFLAEEAEKRFHRPFCRNSLRLYALKNGYDHALPEEKGKVYRRFETSGPGALFQHDSSYHLWLPRTGEKHYLILTKDDYSRRVVGARMVQRETTFGHLQTVRETVTTYGIPLAYYLDNHSIFRFVLHQGVHVRYKLREDEGEIQFRKALSSLGIGMIYTGKRQAQAKGKVEKAFDYFQRRLPYLCEKQKVKEISEAQKILDDLVSYYNDQRIHEEIREIPIQRWEDALNHGKGKLRPLESSIDLDRIFSIHLQRKVRKDGTIMFMGKKWPTGCPEGTPLTICLIPNAKFMIYRDEKKYGSSIYERIRRCPQIASCMCRNDFYVTLDKQSS
jgi:transposase InsO family protein